MVLKNNIAIIAGAGAGKTRAAIEHVKQNIAQRVLVLAFSNIAVQTFRSRCLRAEAEIRTVDSMALKILKRMKGVYLEIIDRTSEPSKFKEYAQKFDLNEIDIQHRKLNGLNEKYAQCLESDGYIDYGIIMQQVMMLPDITQDYGVIIVDEFQDINDIQWAFIERIRGTADLFVVGDPRQNIYSFRGANSSIFKEFAKNAERIELNFNFRSYQEILNVANVYSNQIDPSLSPLISKRGYGGSVAFISEHEMVKHLRDCDTNKTVILTYTREGVSKIIAQLTSHGIPYKSSYSLYRRANIKPTIAVIKAMIEFNRSLTINDALLRNILLRLSGVGKSVIEKLTSLYLTGQLYPQGSLFENLTTFYCDQNCGLKISDKAKKSLIDFMQCFYSSVDLTNDPSVENIIKICDHIIERDIFFEQFISEINDTLNQSTPGNVITTLDNFLTDIESKKKQLDTENTQGVFVSTIHGIKGEQEHTVFFYADDFRKQKREDVLKMSYVAVTRAKENLFIVGKDAYFDKELYDSFESLRAQVESVKDESLDDTDEVESIPVFINPVTGNCLPYYATEMSE